MSPKDGDVQDEHLLNGKPRRLSLVRAENISNTALFDLIKINIDAIIRTLEEVQVVELSSRSLIVTTTANERSPSFPRARDH